jgi:hypothetical protein
MSDDLFHVVEDVQTVLRARGVYRQVKVYHRKGKLYAGWGSGFVTLMRGGSTSHPNITWERNEQLADYIGAESAGCISFVEPKRLTSVKENEAAG